MHNCLSGTAVGTNVILSPMLIYASQGEAMQSYLDDQPDVIFTNVLCLIYVFDIHRKTTETDLMHYEMILEALRSRSPEARVYTLLHKTDLLPSHPPSQVLLRERRVEIEKRAIPTLTHTFATSIWDESLFKAWSSIVHALLPGIEKLELKLAAFAEEMEADEVVLYEPNTLLVLAQTIRRPHHDHHRLEKISSIVKQFRLSCMVKKLTPVRLCIRTASESKSAMVLIVEKISEDAVILITGRTGHLNETQLTKERLTSVINR